MLEFTVRGTAASKCSLSLRYAYKTESYSSRLYSSFHHENHRKTPLSQQTGKWSWPKTSFIYKQRVRAPPSFTSRRRWPVLTLKVAEVQVCLSLNKWNRDSRFFWVWMMIITENRVCSMQVQRKTEFGLIEEVIWSFQIMWIVKL